MRCLIRRFASGMGEVDEASLFLTGQGKVGAFAQLTTKVQGSDTTMSNSSNPAKYKKIQNRVGEGKTLNLTAKSTSDT